MSWHFASISPSLPEHCTPTSSFLVNIFSVFHTCVPTPLSLLSTVLGILSIIAWLFAQIPQIFKNFELQSASGLSILFLIEWLLGDATNLVGSLLTGQASWQVVIAAYYVTVDMILLSQYLWYTHLRPGRRIRLEESKSSHPSGGSDDSIEALDGLLASHESSTSDLNREANTKNDIRESGEDSTSSKFHRGRSHQSYLEFSLREKVVAREADHDRHAVHRSSFAHIPSKNALLLTSALHAVAGEALPLFASKSSQAAELQTPDALMVIGQVTSWSCTCLYLGSRIPQIYKNQRRRSTSGLSPTLFIAAFCGNLFYSSSLLANPLAWFSYPPDGHHGWAGPEGSDRATWVRLAASFWLGAFGVLALDAIIGVQFLRFGEGSEGKKVVAVISDGRGRRRWQKVNGWMRGWIPSSGRMSKGLDEEDDESRRRLLLNTTTRRRYDAM